MDKNCKHTYSRQQIFINLNKKKKIFKSEIIPQPPYESFTTFIQSSLDILLWTTTIPASATAMISSFPFYNRKFS